MSILLDSDDRRELDNLRAMPVAGVDDRTVTLDQVAGFQFAKAPQDNAIGRRRRGDHTASGVRIRRRRRKSRFRALLQLMIFLPFLMPPIITGLSLLVFFREADIPRSLVTVIIGHTVFVLALCYRIILARLQTLRASLVEASLDLGASRWQTFRYVLAPGLLSAIGAAAILAFALSFDETLITLLVTGTDSTLPMRLWAMMRMGFTPDINALVALILVGSTLLALLAIRFVKLPSEH
jgi:putative spermidine/putrescine transport system permease protein/spermidine/putrescine transport system permease protein